MRTAVRTLGERQANDPSAFTVWLHLGNRSVTSSIGRGADSPVNRYRTERDSMTAIVQLLMMFWGVDEAPRRAPRVLIDR